MTTNRHARTRTVLAALTLAAVVGVVELGIGARASGPPATVIQVTPAAAVEAYTGAGTPPAPPASPTTVAPPSTTTTTAPAPRPTTSTTAAPRPTTSTSAAAAPAPAAPPAPDSVCDSSNPDDPACHGSTARDARGYRNPNNGSCVISDSSAPADLVPDDTCYHS